LNDSRCFRFFHPVIVIPSKLFIFIIYMLS
jgi:hypothetical protein